MSLSPLFQIFVFFRTSISYIYLLIYTSCFRILILFSSIWPILQIYFYELFGYWLQAKICENIFLLLLGNKKQCLLFWPIPPFHCQILVWLTFVADTDIYHRHCLSQYFFIRSALFLSSMRAVPHNRKQHPGRSRQTCQNTMDLKWIFLFFWDL